MRAWLVRDGSDSSNKHSYKLVKPVARKLCLIQFDKLYKEAKIGVIREYTNLRLRLRLEFSPRLNANASDKYNNSNLY